MNGFFSRTELSVVKAPVPRVPRCGACGLFKKCKSPKMEPTGRGKKRILIVAEAPGEEEDQQGVQLVGNSGRQLSQTLAKFGINMRNDCTLTNALICRPPGNKITDDQWVDYCRPNLMNTIESLQPEIIILLGATAVKSLIGAIWREDVGGITRWAGWQIPSQRLNAWVCPTFHPAHVLRHDGRRSKDNKDPVLQRMYEEHLEAAVKLTGRPWKKVPDIKSKVRIEMEPSKAARFIREMTTTKKPIAFDYETNKLKPDSSGAEIRCASVSDGKTSIAFPWHGKAVKAMKEFLESDVPKIGYNLKFEDRWSRTILGTPVRNWLWCGMTAAHVIDNRPGITSLKFQAFVRLGVEDYDYHIKPMLKSKERGGNEENRIRDIGLEDLLSYCGIDSYLEYHVANMQMQEMGYSPRIYHDRRKD